MNDETMQLMAVLYADVSGSTKLYEKVGDEMARADIKVCLDLLSELAAKRGGKTLKTIGDEVMCLFQNPVNAAIAATDMHQGLRDASDDGKFQSGSVRVKIGWHYGPIEWRGGDVIGEAPVTAQQIINMAKPEEILASSQALNSLPENLKEDSHFVDSVAADAWVGKLEIYALEWEEEDATIVKHASPGAITPNAILKLMHGNNMVEMNDIRRQIHIGRGEENQLVITGRFTSRHHAEIIYRHGHFTLYDKSTNGTLVIDDNENLRRLHREELVLNGSGTICFGGTPDVDPDAAVQFKCKV
jgi:hypothetical protein